MHTEQNQQTEFIRQCKDIGVRGMNTMAMNCPSRPEGETFVSFFKMSLDSSKLTLARVQISYIY